jgi:tetratricopeptide (TPR) repeat protein
MLPHVLAAVSFYEEPQTDHLALPDVAWLLDRAATYLQVQARLHEARPLAERALAITEYACRPDHPEVAARLNNLALILRDLGQYRHALPLSERAMAIAEAAYGPDHPHVATHLTNLAAANTTVRCASIASRRPGSPSKPSPV